MSKDNPAWGKPNSPVGRVNRKEYLISSICLFVYTFLVLLFGTLASGFVAGMAGKFAGIAVGILFIAWAGYLYWKYLMVCVKRWHDLNLSGWMCLITFACSILPFFYLIALLTKQMELFLTVVYIHDYAQWGFAILSLIQLFVKGTKGPNKYGPDPLEQKIG